MKLTLLQEMFMWFYSNTVRCLNVLFLFIELVQKKKVNLAVQIMNHM